MQQTAQLSHFLRGMLLTVMILIQPGIALFGQSSVNREARDAEDALAVFVSFHKNIELFGYMIHLAEPEENDPAHPISVELGKWPEDVNDASLAEIYERAADISYGFFIELFVHLPEFPLPAPYELPYGVLEKYGYTTDAEIDKVKALIRLSDRFSRDSGFEALWSNLEPFRIETTETLRAIINTQGFAGMLAEMEVFYQQDFPAYRFIPSLTLWSGPGWGFKVESDLGQTATFVLGPLGKNFDYADTTRLITLSTHEFGHSFVNHLVLENLPAHIRDTEKLFVPVEEDMIPQGYSTWETCLIEHVVRAGEVLIPEVAGNKALARSNLQYNTEQKSFIYLPFIVDHLRDYRLNKGLSYKRSLINTMVDLQNTYR